MEQIRITVPGIKKSLRNFDVKKAISEYIWNGFDAGANVVEIEFDDNQIGGIESLRIRDNGYGIDYQRLDKTFRPFFESEKALDDVVKRKAKISAIHGKNGVGRLTFFTFAREANWYTVFENGGGKQQYVITIQTNTLNEYSSTLPETSQYAVGTMVEFTDIQNLTIYDFEEDIPVFLMKRFGWFLELNSARDFSITINGERLDYSGIVGERDDFVHHEHLDNEELTFDVRYVRWTNRLIDEYSHYYFVGSDKKERFKKTTTLNNKGDKFYHSVYIESGYFDVVTAWDDGGSWKEANGQMSLAIISQSDEAFKKLLTTIDLFLRNKRKPFLRKYTDTLINQYSKEGVFPQHNGNAWDNRRHQELENVVRELYQIEPRIFSNLNVEQKKTLVHLLNLIMAEGERDSLLVVLQEVIDLEPSELEELAKLLRTSKLSNVVKTIRLIEDRYRAIEQLRALVFDVDIKANEPKHIQKMIENHYWVFGEQYHLVTAAEPKFEEALRRYIYLLRGEKSNPKLDHQNKKREMDIFMVRWAKLTNRINNIVVELKNPRIRLGSKEVEQVKRYMQVIQSESEFNAPNMTWEFYLVGNKFDTSGYIEGEIENARQHGEPSLVYAVQGKKYKIFVKTWSELFTEFELRHGFLLDRLKHEREQISETYEDADTIIHAQHKNSAIRPPEIEVPKE